MPRAAFTGRFILIVSNCVTHCSWKIKSLTPLFSSTRQALQPTQTANTSNPKLTLSESITLLVHYFFLEMEHSLHVWKQCLHVGMAQRQRCHWNEHWFVLIPWLIPFPLCLGMVGMARGFMAQTVPGSHSDHYCSFCVNLRNFPQWAWKLKDPYGKKKNNQNAKIFTSWIHANFPPNMASTELPFLFRQVNFFVPKGM